MAQRRRFAQAQRRQTTWSVGPDEVGGQTIASTGSQLATTGAQLVISSATLVRIRGRLDLTLDTFGTANDGYAGAVGICIVSENAFGIGVTAVPTPVTDEGWDGWIWHQYFNVHSVTATVADGSNAVAVVRSIEVDSKAMRKWKQTDIMCVSLEALESGAAQMQWNFQCRLLLKLP